MARSYFTHDNWLELQADKGVPVLSDCYVEDLRTLELAHWDIRDCDTAFIRFTDMGGVTEARVQEIPAGGSLKPFKLGVEEMVYVLKGRGFASVWGEISNAKRDFEWSDRSVFVIPRNSWCELRNMGSTPVRLLFYNYLPIGMSVIPDPEFFTEQPARQQEHSRRRGGRFLLGGQGHRERFRQRMGRGRRDGLERQLLA